MVQQQYSNAATPQEPALLHPPCLKNIRTGVAQSWNELFAAQQTPFKQKNLYESPVWWRQFRHGH